MKTLVIAVVVAIVASIVLPPVPAEAQCRTTWINGESPNCGSPSTTVAQAPTLAPATTNTTQGLTALLRLDWRQLSDKDKSQFKGKSHGEVPLSNFEENSTLRRASTRAKVIEVVNGVSAIGIIGTLSLTVLTATTGGMPGFFFAWAVAIAVVDRAAVAALSTPVEPDQSFFTEMDKLLCKLVIAMRKNIGSDEDKARWHDRTVAYDPCQ
jgi:hypothetical protein